MNIPQTLWEGGRFPLIVWLMGLVFNVGLLIGDRAPDKVISWGVVLFALAWTVAGLVLMVRAWSVRENGTEAASVSPDQK